MASLGDTIRQNQLLAYFVLACAIMWTFSIPTLLFPEEILSELFMGVAVFGPALACIIVSKLANTRPREGNRRTFWIAFSVSFLLITIVASLYFITNSADGSIPAFVLVSAIFSIIPSIVVASAFSTTPGLKETLSSLVKPKGNPIWYIIAIITVPIILLVSVVITDFVGGEFVSEPVQAASQLELAWLIIITFLFTFVFSGGINEETGWTGFALPKLQDKQSPLVASISLWFLWMLWHMPLHFAGLWNPSVEALFHTLLGLFFLRFVFTWLYNRTNGSILSGSLLHTSANIATIFIPMTYTQIIIAAMLAFTVIVGDKMWRKIPSKDYSFTDEKNE